MVTIELELALRFEEIRYVGTHLELMEIGDFQYQTAFGGHIPVLACTKAGIVLMLYNAVESTITKCIDRIHRELIASNLNFYECNDAIQKLIIVYHENAKAKSNDIHSQVPYIISLNNYLKGYCTFGLSYEDLQKYYTLYSGNLDAKEIFSVLKQYGVLDEQPDALKVSELNRIKKYRNELAHGEKSFEEVGREIPRQYLNVMIDKTNNFLSEVIAVIKDFLANQKFKKDPS